MAYASKYYDPQKAHEYYLKHRQLKGKNSRTSTKGLNEAGKVAAKEVKEGIKAEQKEFFNKIKETVNNAIKRLREELKGMSKEERKARKEEFKEKIAQLRQVAKDTKAQAKEFFQEKYAQEMDKIKQDASFRQGSKSKGKKKK